MKRKERKNGKKSDTVTNVFLQNILTDYIVYQRYSILRELGEKLLNYASFRQIKLRKTAHITKKTVQKTVNINSWSKTLSLKRKEKIKIKKLNSNREMFKEQF